MTQLWAWEYEGKTEIGSVEGESSDYLDLRIALPKDNGKGTTVYWRSRSAVTNLRKVKVVDETEQKTYLTTEQFIKVYKSLSDEKSRELGKAWNEARSVAWYAAWSVGRYAGRDTAWYAAWDADLAVLAKDKITAEQFEILTSPWTSCGLSLYAEDWEQVLNPKVVEPKNFGAIVEASTRHYGFQSWFLAKNGTWTGEDEDHIDWSDLINPVVISEGQK